MQYPAFTAQNVTSLRLEAQQKGLFLPVSESTAALEQTELLHGREIKNRKVMQITFVSDATEQGAPTEATVQRYAAAASSSAGMVWSEPIAICPEGRMDKAQLCLTQETLPAFTAMVSAMRQAAQNQGEAAPILIAVLDHAGRYAMIPQPVDRCPVLSHESAALISDETLSKLIVTVGETARLAEQAGFDGIAIHAAHRNLFSESLAAFSRDGVFGGDFEDRTRFLRDCFTAASLTVNNSFLCIRLNLYDGIPQPHGWGMAFEDAYAPDLSEPSLLLRVLHELYDVTLVSCEAGDPHYNPYVQCPVEGDNLPEHPLVGISRLCTCTAMIDSALQQNVKLILPNCSYLQQLAPHLGAGMIAEEFASFAVL
ncbi:MAG: hypothetical protein IKM30_05175 [Oscillospiraceae bacterium]|nr:hypothetical protein [Oscillospiraceae bacterium]